MIDDGRWTAATAGEGRRMGGPCRRFAHRNREEQRVGRGRGRAGVPIWNPAMDLDYLKFPLGFILPDFNLSFRETPGHKAADTDRREEEEGKGKEGRKEGKNEDRQPGQGQAPGRRAHNCKVSLTSPSVTEVPHPMFYCREILGTRLLRPKREMRRRGSRELGGG